MNQNRAVRFALNATVVVLVAVSIGMIGFFRTSANLFAVICGVAFFFIPAARRRVATLGFWIGFLALSLLPVDVSFRTRPGPPGFVPVLYGLPMGGEFYEQEKRGELILGGCVVSPGSSKWVVVW